MATPSPFIPPLLTPTSSNAPQLPSMNSSGQGHSPGWPQAGQPTVYPSSPYAGAPFLPQETPYTRALDPNSAYEANASAARGRQVSLDYTGYPNFTQSTPHTGATAQLPATAWGGPGVQMPPSSTGAPQIPPFGPGAGASGGLPHMTPGAGVLPQLPPHMTPYGLAAGGLPPQIPPFGSATGGAPYGGLPSAGPLGTPWGGPRGFGPQQPPYSAGFGPAGAYPPAPYPPAPYPPAHPPMWGPYTPGAPGSMPHSTPATVPSDPWGIGAMHTPWSGGIPLSQPGMRMARAPEDNGDRLSPWMEGPNYGPVLTPLMVRLVNVQPRINPLLGPPVLDAVDNPPDFLKWNMLFRTNFCQRSSDRNNRSWVKGRREPATFPRVTALRIVSRSIPFHTEVVATDPRVGVTCEDVIESISMEMYKHSSSAEFNRLSPEKKRFLTEAYYHNRSTANGVPGGSLGQGMLRMDWLGRDTIYGGIQVNNEFVKNLCGAPVPTTFELLCTQRYPLTRQEIAEQEALAERQRQREREAAQRERELEAAMSASTLSDATLSEAGTAYSESRRGRSRQSSRQSIHRTTLESVTDDDVAP